MTLSFSQATARTLLCLGSLICLANPAVALEVKARLDTHSIRFGETVRLTLEADAQPAPGPDLSPLQEHFRIVGRSSSRQVREINGQRAERHELHLTLSPLRSGHLAIPAIAFGEVATQPLSLEVSANAEVSVQGAPSVPLADPPPANTRPLEDASTSARPAAGHPGMPPPTPAPSITTHLPTPETKPWRHLILASWPTLSVLGAILGVMGFMWKWRQRRPRFDRSHPSQDQPRPPASPHPATPPASFQGDPLGTAITAVQQAYAAGDATTARDALLAWAALALPDQPPANLALLAKRSPEPLRSDILLVEQTLFTPRPVDWNHRRTWEHLSDFVPLPPEQPVSFRQKKPLHRPPRPQPADR